MGHPDPEPSPRLEDLAAAFIVAADHPDPLGVADADLTRDVVGEAELLTFVAATKRAISGT